MRRVKRFCRTHSRRASSVLVPVPRPLKNEDSQSADFSRDTPSIPAAIWVTHVLPYLDRVSQNRLCATCKDIYETSQQSEYEVAWPQGKFRFKKPILAVAFSSDSSSLAIVPANSKMILMWHRRHGLDQTLAGHGGIVSDVTFSNNGLLASCSRTDGTIRLWSKKEEFSASSMKCSQYYCTKQLILRVFAMRYLRFSPCGEMIAVWGNDRMIRLERIHGGSDSNVGSVPLRSRLGIKCCDCVVFPKRSNRNILAYTFNNEQVRLWNWDSKTTIELRDLERTVPVGDYDAYVTAMTTVHVDIMDGIREYLVVGCRVATLKLWNLTDYSCVRSFHLGSGWSAVTNIVFTRDGTKMACTGEGSKIRVFDVDTSECVAVLKDHKERVESLSFSPDGRTLASGACDRTVRLWDLASVLPSQIVH